MFFVLEDDKRGKYLSQILLDNGYYVTNNINDLKYAKYIYLGLKGIDCQNRITINNQTFILDVKNIKNNVKIFTISENKYLRELSKEKQFEYYSLLYDEGFLSLNTILTSEGFISFMIQKINRPLYFSKILILGYGRCAKEIGKRLKNFHCDITISARKKYLQNEAKENGFKFNCLDQLNLNQYDFVINTIPFIVIDKNILENINNEITFFDIASFPYGIDHHEALKLGFDTYIVSSIPDRYFPMYSAQNIYQYIIKKVRCYD